MNKETLAELLVRLTIYKAKKEGKHPMEILEKVKRLIQQKRIMERNRIVQTVSTKVSDNLGMSNSLLCQVWCGTHEDRYGYSETRHLIIRKLENKRCRKIWNY